MRLKSIIAPDMAEAMRQVRKQCGEDAVIVSTQESPGEVLLMVAVPRESEADGPRDAPAAAPPPAEEPIDTIADVLVWHGVPSPLAGRIVAAAEAVAHPTAQEMLAGALARTLRFGRLPCGTPSSRRSSPPLLLAGPPGAGKTVSIAKLAIRAVLEGATPAVVTLDDKAGAVAQLETFCKAAGIDLQRAEDDRTLADALAAAGPRAPVLIDTPGVDPYAPADLASIARRAAVAGAIPVLTLPCGLDAAEAGDIAATFRAAGAAHLVVTRLDMARRFGSVLAAADAGGLALVEAGASRRVAEAMVPLDAASLARRLLAVATPSITQNMATSAKRRAIA